MGFIARPIRTILVGATIAAIVCGYDLTTGTSLIAYAAEYNPPPPPPLKSVKTGRDPGGSLSDAVCHAGKDRLVALAPIDERYKSPTSKNGLVYGRTTAEQPRVWMMTRCTSGTGYPLTISLRDEQNKQVGTARTFVLPTNPSVIALPMPIALETGKAYRWVVELDRGNAVDTIAGWIHRESATINRDQSPISLASAYAEAGFWYDAVDVLALQKSQPSANADIQKAWTELLAEVGLDKLASEPVNAPN